MNMIIVPCIGLIVLCIALIWTSIQHIKDIDELDEANLKLIRCYDREVKRYERRIKKLKLERDTLLKYIEVQNERKD